MSNPAPERSVPVVDLTGLVGDLRALAATRRVEAEAFLEAARNLAAGYEREAGYLDDLAEVLDGRVQPSRWVPDGSRG